MAEGLVYGSVCSGIEAASVAWEPLGWRPAFVSEIEPFPCAVLAHHWPEVPNIGDFTRAEAVPGPIDLLVGGTPCQSFSVAGKRLGLDDPRGNLAIEFLRLARRLRPRWVVFENVPGLLSSGGGRDFGAFLGLLGELGYGWAYRVLDAQYFGVPQRRRRVFVVGHLGDWRRAIAVLFERDCLSGNPPPGREAGQGAPPSVAGCLNSGGNDGGFRTEPGEHLVAGTLSAIYAKQSHNGMVEMVNGLVAPTLFASNGGVSSGYHPVVPVAYQCQGSNVGPMGTVRSGNGNATGGVPFTVQALYSEGNGPHARQAAVAKCIDSHGGNPDCNNGGTLVAEPTAFAWHQGGATALGLGLPGVPPVRTKMNPAAHIGSAVRRLTPRECERLQGFPDDYTAVPFKGKPAKDGPRYKALGNSMAVPCMAWIGRRVQMVEGLR